MSSLTVIGQILETAIYVFEHSNSVTTRFHANVVENFSQNHQNPIGVFVPNSVVGLGTRALVAHATGISEFWNPMENTNGAVSSKVSMAQIPTNRYHVFGKSVLRDKMMNCYIYRFLNDHSKSLRVEGHITWYQKKPYVRDGHETKVREYLLQNIPRTQRWNGSNYGFLD